MRIEWQVVALSVLVVAGGACVPAGSKTSEDTTEDTVDDGSGGGGTDTEVTVEECYPGNVSREVSECLIEAAGDGYLGLDGWTQDQYLNAFGWLSCNAEMYRTAAMAEFEANLEVSTCWDKCEEGDECADYIAQAAECRRVYHMCVASALEAFSLVQCDENSVELAQFFTDLDDCADASTPCTPPPRSECSL